jgi:hypothetical protein
VPGGKANGEIELVQDDRLQVAVERFSLDLGQVDRMDRVTARSPPTKKSNRFDFMSGCAL